MTVRSAPAESRPGEEPIPTSAEHALQFALSNLRVAISESEARITHEPLPVVIANERQLVQLFHCLIGNAIKHQRGGIPRVHISAAQADPGPWIFSVRDNGLGVDPRTFEKILGASQRPHDREFVGTDFGLTICKKIVERHGGSISVVSTRGLGSTFHFSLGSKVRI
jgi:light-regulated signal transduction histidine kinase (bacteriophytochrome)